MLDNLNWKKIHHKSNMFPFQWTFPGGVEGSDLGSHPSEQA